MEEEQLQTTADITPKESCWTTVTPFSKYLALALFVLMPFIGGWVGYHFSPEKVIEVARVVVVEKVVEVEETPVTEEPQETGYMTEAGYVATEPVEDWSVCENKEMGYKVKYPSDWRMGTTLGGEGFTEKEGCDSDYVVFGDYKDDESYTYSIRIQSRDVFNTEEGYNYKNVTSVDEFLNSVLTPPRSNFREKFILDGEEAVYREKSPDPTVYTFYNDRIVKISGTNVSQKTFDDFLSTFEFLE